MHNNKSKNHKKDSKFLSDLYLIHTKINIIKNIAKNHNITELGLLGFDLEEINESNGKITMLIDYPDNIKIQDLLDFMTDIIYELKMEINFLSKKSSIGNNSKKAFMGKVLNIFREY